jgi:anti-sigma B factor antagonist
MMTSNPKETTGMLKINERQVEGVTILDLEGNVIMGGGSQLLRDTIRRLIEEGKKQVLLNFGGVKYIDSSGVGELVSGLVALNREAGQLRLFNLTERVEEVMTLSSLLSLFEIFTDEATALEAAK